MIRVVAFPLYILTLGLISLLVNGLLLWITAWISGFFGWGFGGFSFDVIGSPLR